MSGFNTRGYSSYRGRGGGSKKPLIIILCVILAAALVFLALQRYMVYGADGSVRYVFPWMTEQTEQPKAPQSAEPSAEKTPAAPQDLEIIIEKPPVVEITELHGLELSTDVLRGSMETVLAGLEGQNVNTLALRVKNDTGELLYKSEMAGAIEAGAVAGSSVSNAAIADLTATDYHAIARISALHDSKFSFAHMQDAGVLQLNYKGYIWYNPQSTFFLAPEKELTRQYLCDIARECAAMGFDELLFDEFTYPTTGRLNNIDESARTVSKEEALRLLAVSLRESVKDYDVKLSVVLDEATVLAGGNEIAGQNVADLAECFDRVYVATTPEKVPELQAALEPYTAELVPMLTAPAAEGSYLIVQ